MDALLAAPARSRRPSARADEAALPDAKAAQTARRTAPPPRGGRGRRRGCAARLDAVLAAAGPKNALLGTARVRAAPRLPPPALLEETRRLLTAASAKLVATTLETELCADVEAREDARALGCVVEVQRPPRERKARAGGFDLSAPAKKSCRTASTRRRAGSRRRSSSSAARRRAPPPPPPPAARIVDRDVRLEDREAEEARAAAHAGAIDAMFERAMAVKEAKPKGR